MRAVNRETERRAFKRKYVYRRQGVRLDANIYSDTMSFDVFIYAEWDGCFAL